MAKSGISVNKVDFRKQADRVAKHYGLNVKDIMRHQMVLWGKDLVKRTYPVKKGSSRAFDVSQTGTLAQAIANDIKRAFRVVKGLKGNNKRISSLGAHLRDNRDKRTGKVRRQFGRGSAEWRPVISEREARRLLRDALKRFGQAKSGWLPMIEHFGGSIAGIAKSIRTGPGIYRRSGGTLDRMSLKGNGSLIGLNTVPYAKRMARRSLLMFTAKIRDRDLRRQLKTGVGRTIEFARKQKAA